MCTCFRSYRDLVQLFQPKVRTTQAASRPLPRPLLPLTVSLLYSKKGS
jgi:hypothetical protein